MKHAFRRARLVAIVAAFGLVGACSSSSSNADPTTTSTAATTMAAHDHSTTLPPAVDRALTPVEGPYGVGRNGLTLVDDTRDAQGEPTDDPDAEFRTLEVTILYPTDYPDENDNTPRSVAKGVFPLVVFAHGVTANGPLYVDTVTPLVKAGYVVALPTFPITSKPDGWDHLDQVPAQAHDISYLIGRLLALSSHTNTLLDGHLSSSAVAVAGHSLGAVTSLLFYNTCCRDDRVRAVVALSGVPFPDTGDDADSYDDPPTDVPLLLLHGTEDDTVPFSGSEEAFELLDTVPRALVRFDGLGHTDIAAAPLLAPTIVGFLDMTLRGDFDAWDGAVTAIEGDADASVEIAGEMPGG